MPSGAQIIDEASQVDLATGALALVCAKKAVIDDDRKQRERTAGSGAAKSMRKHEKNACSLRDNMI